LAPKKKKKALETMHAAKAMMEAFKIVDDIEPVNLMHRNHVEDALSSGSLALDLVTDGGYGRGRMVTYFGPEASGKSTMLQEVIASAQRSNIPTTHYDIETSADKTYMQRQGINLNWQVKMDAEKSCAGYFCTQPIAGEHVYRHIKATLRRMHPVDSGPPRALFIIDSYASMMAEALADDEEGKQTMALEPRMHSQQMKQIRGLMRRRGGLLVASNQIRANIGSWGGGFDETGGNALKFYPDYRIRMTRKMKIDHDSTNLRRLLVNWVVMKNRLFPPLKAVEEMGIILGRGIDKAQDAHHFLEQTGLLSKKAGRRIIGHPDFPDSSLTWAEFRELTERADVRKFFFGMLRQQDTYDRFFAHANDANLTYDVVVKAPTGRKKKKKKLTGTSRRTAAIEVSETSSEEEEE